MSVFLVGHLILSSRVSSRGDTICLSLLNANRMSAFVGMDFGKGFKCLIYTQTQEVKERNVLQRIRFFLEVPRLYKLVVFVL